MQKTGREQGGEAVAYIKGGVDRTAKRLHAKKGRDRAAKWLFSKNRA